MYNTNQYVKIIYLHISTKFYIPLISNSYINIFTTVIVSILVYHNPRFQYTQGTDVKMFIRSQTVQVIYISQYTVMTTSRWESKVALKQYQGNLLKKTLLNLYKWTTENMRELTKTMKKYDIRLFWYKSIGSQDTGSGTNLKTRFSVFSDMIMV